MGFAYEQLNQYDKAAEVYCQAIEIDPHIDGEVHFRLGWSYFQIKRYPEAIVAFKKAIETKPDFPKAYSSLCEIHLILKNYPAFQDAWVHLRELAPDLAEEMKKKFSFQEFLVR